MWKSPVKTDTKVKKLFFGRKKGTFTGKNGFGRKGKTDEKGKEKERGAEREKRGKKKS